MHYTKKIMNYITLIPATALESVPETERIPTNPLFLKSPRLNN